MPDIARPIDNYSDIINLVHRKSLMICVIQFAHRFSDSPVPWF